jgi:hypothetical protein
VKDVNLDRREIVVRDGNGVKDRRTPLAETAVVPLTRWLRAGEELFRRDRKLDVRSTGIAPAGSPNECEVTLLGQPALVAREHVREAGTWHWSAVRLGRDVRVALRGTSPYRADEAIFLRAVRSASR